MTNRLTAIANARGSDKGDLHNDAHHYTRVYDALFAPLADMPVRLLEIGLLHPKDPRWSNTNGVPHKGGGVAAAAPSLEMWLDYFQNAEIHGFDLNDFSAVTLERCTIHRGDSSNVEDLRRVARSGPFDIIIDDASHASAHQQIALGVLFASVKAGGYYIIEDLQWQPAALENPHTPKTRAMLEALKFTGRLDSPHIDPHRAAEIERQCRDVMFFDSLDPRNVLGGRDALGVIAK